MTGDERQVAVLYCTVLYTSIYNLLTVTRTELITLKASSGIGKSQQDGNHALRRFESAPMLRFTGTVDAQSVTM